MSSSSSSLHFLLLLVVLLPLLRAIRNDALTHESYVKLDNQLSEVRIRVSQSEWRYLFPDDDTPISLFEGRGRVCRHFVCYPQASPPMFFCQSRFNDIHERICYNETGHTLYRCARRVPLTQRYYDTLSELVECLTISRWAIVRRGAVTPSDVCTVNKPPVRLLFLCSTNSISRGVREQVVFFRNKSLIRSHVGVNSSKYSYS